MTMSHTVGELAEAAKVGEQWAWNELVERYTPLVRSVTRGYRLSAADSLDVSQTLWLRLVEHLADIRNPEALPGWIVTTTRNEALRVIKVRQRNPSMDPMHTLWQDPEVQGGMSPGEAVSEELERAERHQALREALAQLRPRHRELLLLLLCDPPLSYDQISDQLQMPKGSIGPTRARALAELRNSPALKPFLPTSDTGPRT